MTRLAILTLLFLSVSRVAVAADERAADAMITRGLELRREGKAADALEMFQRAHALAPSPRTLGQMGLAEASLDHWTDAENHLTASLATAQDPWVKKNRSLLDQALLVAKRHIGEIAFSGPSGASITVAGKAAGTLPDVPPIRVGEGTVLVTATAAGFKQFIVSVPVQGGMQTPLNIALDPIDVRPSLPPPGPTTQSPGVADLHAHYSWRTWTGGSLIAVGGGLLVWGVAWIAVDGRSSGGACASSSPAPCRPVYDTKTAGWILTASGAAAAAAGTFLLYTAKNSGTDVTIGLGPTSLVLGGRF